MSEVQAEYAAITVIDNSNWYPVLVDDCKAIICERLYRSRQEVIECWHEVGERICTDDNYQKAAKGNLKLQKQLARDMEKSITSLYYAVQFFNKFPILSTAVETFEEGKNISWTRRF